VPTSGTGGLGEAICDHFGCAPYFTIVDTDDGSVSCFENPNHDHEYGHCNPDASLGGRGVDVVLLPKISARLVMRLDEMGIRVYLSKAESVGEALRLLQAGSLKMIKVLHRSDDPGAQA
jgi:predicted Fe-Mo cluster-binding NifX family protein